jgi:hypothetical protein
MDYFTRMVIESNKDYYIDDEKDKDSGGDKGDLVITD